MPAESATARERYFVSLHEATEAEERDLTFADLFLSAPELDRVESDLGELDRHYAWTRIFAVSA